MKILFVVQAYAPSLGGVQWLTQNLAERMAADFGDEVSVFTTTAYRSQLFIDHSQPALPAGEEEINGVSVRRFPVFNRLAGLRLNAARLGHKLHLPGQDQLRILYFGPIVRGLVDAVARSQADVVVASSFPMRHVYNALRGGKQSGKPVVIIGTVHPTDPWAYDLPCMVQAIRTADAYVALSRYEADYLAARGVPLDHLNIIGAGVDMNAFDRVDLAAAGHAFRQRRNLGAGPVLTLLGRQTSYKRADVAIAAMQQVWPQFPAAQLLLAGARADYSPQLEALKAELSLEQQQQITILPDFDESEKVALLGATDVLLQPSNRESFGIVFLEAWAASVPVIGANQGAASTVIDEGEDGLLAAFGDVDDWARAIVQLLSSPYLRIRMGAKGREKIDRQYRWEMVTQRFRQLLERVQ
jgi:glycosyltransferase involved in cell wall biosynthesis